MIMPTANAPGDMSDEDVVGIMTDMTALLHGTGIAHANRQTMVSLAERLISLAKTGRPDEAETMMHLIQHL
jgi:hypothetical protein